MENNKQNNYPSIWVQDVLNKDFQLSLRVKETLYSKQSSFQRVDVVDTYEVGKVLLNDGIFMLSEKDEFIYHEMISHVALFSHSSPKRVLIIGGGDGGTAREVLRHECLEKIVMVEIDEAVVEACRLHIPQTGECLNQHDPRFELLIDDGVAYIKNHIQQQQQKFDVIIVDSTDPIGPAAPLFNHSFYQNVKQCLNEGGVVVSQAESPFLLQEEQKHLLQILKDTFESVHVYNYCNMVYPGGPYSFSIAGNGQLDPQKIVREEDAKELFTQYYSLEMHKSSFILPRFQRDYLKQILL